MGKVSIETRNRCKEHYRSIKKYDIGALFTGVIVNGVCTLLKEVAGYGIKRHSK